MTALNAASEARHPAVHRPMHVVDARESPTSRDHRAGGGAGPRGLYSTSRSRARRFSVALDDEALAPFRTRCGARPCACMELNSSPSFDRAGYLRHLPRSAASSLSGARVPSRDGTAGRPVRDRRPVGRSRTALAVIAATISCSGSCSRSAGAVWVYPYPEAQALIRGLRDLSAPAPDLVPTCPMSSASAPTSSRRLRPPLLRLSPHARRT
jgi:hypothetical protein